MFRFFSVVLIIYRNKFVLTQYRLPDFTQDIKYLRYVIENRINLINNLSPHIRGLLQTSFGNHLVCDPRFPKIKGNLRALPDIINYVPWPLISLPCQAIKNRLRTPTISSHKVRREKLFPNLVERFWATLR